MSRVVSSGIARWHLLIGAALMAVLLITMSGGSYARANGTPSGTLTFLEVQRDGVDGVDGLDGPYSVTVSPDGNHLYAAGYIDAAVAVFSRDSTTGALTFVEIHKDGERGVDGLSGAYSVVVSPNGSHLYAAGYQDDAVAVFSRNSTTGALTFVDVHKDGEGGVDGLDAVWSVTVSPDGSHLYAAGSADDAVAVFNRDSTTGRLTFVEVQRDGVGDVDGLYGASSVTVSPDGTHLYATGYSDDAVAVFSRNPATGALTFVDFHKDGENGVDGLYAAYSVTVSPDGNHLYAGGYFDDAVAVFSRDPDTGSLTFVEVHKDGVNGVDGLNGTTSVKVSPHGSHLYASGDSDDAVAVFSRNSATGSLTFMEVHKDGVDGVDGLSGASSVTVSPDGSHLYASGYSDDAVVVFSSSISDLAVSKSVDDSSPYEGGTVTFNVTVTNNGPDTAAGMVVSDALPSGLIFQSADPSDGAYSIGTGNWTLESSLAVGDSSTLTIVAIVDIKVDSDGTTITNTASLMAFPQLDPDASNDTASVALTVSSVTHSCNGLPATRVGTEGADTITGTAGNDVIHALGGDDIVLGMEGDDTICGGDGDDFISGGDGKDGIWGEAGEDVLRGGRGKDRLYGGTHDDVLKGGRHNDRLHGGKGNDTLVGGKGKDKLYGNKGDDGLFGRAGDDSHNCGPGTDMANGGPGANDTETDCEASLAIP